MNALSLHVSSDREPLAMPDDRVGDEGLREILPIQSDYPDRLRQMAKAPTVWLRGRADLLSGRPICTVVGSRACSRLAEDRAVELGRKLGERGVLVVSGGALGIDAAAHQGALAVGDVYKRQLASWAVHRPAIPASADRLVQGGHRCRR